MTHTCDDSCEGRCPYLLLLEVISSGIEFEDERLSYLTVQVPVVVWEQIHALLNKNPARRKE